jgi:hypothetical protein
MMMKKQTKGKSVSAFLLVPLVWLQNLCSFDKKKKKKFTYSRTQNGVSLNTLYFKTRLFFVLRSKCEYYFITTIRTFTITTLLTALVKRRAVTACDGRRRRRRERRLFHPRERYRAVLFWRRRICCCSRCCKTWICGLNRWFPRRRRRRCRIDRRF